MSTELQEIKQLILKTTAQNQTKLEDLEQKLSESNENFNSFKTGVYQQFEKLGQFIGEETRALGIQLEKNNSSIQLIAEQHMSIIEKIDANATEIQRNHARLEGHHNRITSLEL